MKNWSKKKKLFGGLIALFLVLQAIQPPKNKGNSGGPKDIIQTIQVPDNIFALLKTSCYDCHSNRTIYPWYDNITPVNWWVSNHISEGKKELNFTSFGKYPQRIQFKKLDQIAETVKEGGMPIKSYLLTHGDAKLSEAEKLLIFNWARNAMEGIYKLP